MGSSHDLGRVRADGWYAQLLRDAPQLEEVANLLGDKTLAFLAVAGLELLSIEVDPRDAEQTLVGLRPPGGEAFELPLGALRRRLSEALAEPEPRAATLADEPTEDELRAFIGPRLLLLAPLYGLRLGALRVAEDGRAFLSVQAAGEAEEVPLEALAGLVASRVRAEGGAAAAPFHIDLEKVPRAAQHNAAGEYAETLALLGSWPGPLSVLLRTEQGRELTVEAKATLAHALGHLATAQLATGHGGMADDVLRLGIQWAQEESGPVAAELYRTLATATLARGEAGQAIGLLRRALTLGAPPATVLPELAKAFAAVDKTPPGPARRPTGHRGGLGHGPRRAGGGGRRGTRRALGALRPGTSRSLRDRGREAGRGRATARFDLRATRERYLLTLRSPCQAGPFRVVRLELEAPVRGALDLEAGPETLLRRRLRLRRLSARASPAALRTSLPGVEILPSAGAPGTVDLAVADSVGVLVVRLRPLAYEGDLLAFVEDLRFVVEGPFSPWKRLARALAALDLPFDATLGAFRYAAPLRRVLAETFLAQGWRLPAIEADFGIELAGGVGLEVRPEASPAPELAACLRRAALLPRLLEGKAHATDACPAWVEAVLEGRAAGAAGALAEALEGDGPPRRWLTAHRLFRDGEPSTRLRAESAHRTAERLLEAEVAERHVPVEGATLEALVRDALSAGGAAWGQWIRRLAERGRPEALRLAGAGLRGNGATADRAQIAAEAVAAVLGDWDSEEGSPPEVLLLEAVPIVEAVRRLSPELAAGRAAEACVLQARGRLAEAAQAWRSAADASTDVPERAGLWRRRAAELVLALDGMAAAEPLLRQVLLERRDDPRTLARLAELAAERGDEDEAEALFQRILRAPDGLPGEREDALLSASRYYVERGDGDRARPFTAALGPSLGASARRGDVAPPSDVGPKGGRGLGERRSRRRRARLSLAGLAERPCRRPRPRERRGARRRRGTSGGAARAPPPRRRRW